MLLADGHIAKYTGSKPVGWGATPGAARPPRPTTTPTCPTSPAGPGRRQRRPSGLSLTLAVLAQLTQARAAASATAISIPGRPVVCSDRGGSYPKTFKDVHAAGYDSISWRRAPLAATGGLPVLATNGHYGTDRMIACTHEVVALDGYPGPIRRISLFEHRKMVAQLLTSCCAVAPGRSPACCAPGGSSRTS